jgi:hypothetical protein
MTKEDTPKAGDVIYVPAALHVYRGRDDFHGGKAIVSRVEEKWNSLFVEIEPRPGNGYNWAILKEQQEALANEYGDTWAYPDPDLRPEFNDDNADWRP